MRLAAIKRKSMADTQCMPGNTAFGLHPPQQALHLRHSHYLPVTLTSQHAAQSCLSWLRHIKHSLAAPTCMPYMAHQHCPA